MVVAGSCIVVTRQITAVTERVARGSTRDAILYSFKGIFRTATPTPLVLLTE